MSAHCVPVQRGEMKISSGVALPWILTPKQQQWKKKRLLIKQIRNNLIDPFVSWNWILMALLNRPLFAI